MDEIAKLQEEFMRLQKQQASHSISERVCVEILLKLIQREKVKVYYTFDRKEFITPKQLSHEIQDEILSSGGRIELMDLYPLLNLDESVIEATTRELVENDRSLSIIENTIVADYYIDKVAEEINESLVESGQLNLSSLSQRFSLPLDYITNLISVRLVSAPPSRYRRFIDGFLAPPLLYTQAFITRHKAILRGVLSGITVPTSLQQISQYVECDESMFYSIFTELTQSSRIPGSLQGRGEATEFVPNIYIEHRASAVEQFFKQNGYIEYSTMQNQYKILQPQKYLKTNFPDGISLPNCYLSSTEISLLEDSIEETIQQEEWLNAQPLLPSPLTDDDVSAVLRECNVFKETKKPLAFHMCDIYVVSSGLLNNLLKKYEERYKIWAQEDTGSRKELLASADDLRLSSGSIGSIDDDTEDDDLRSSGKGKKNKRRKGKKKKEPSPQQNTQQLAETYNKQNREYLQEWQPEMPECLIDAIVLELHSRLVELREAAARAIFMDSSAKKKFDGRDWQVELQQLYSNIIQYHHAAEEFPGDSIPLDKHLLRTMCTDIAYLLIEAGAAQNFIKLDHSPLENVKQRNLALKKMKKLSPLHDELSALCSSLAKSVPEFLECVEPVFETLGLRMKVLDKKSEKVLVQAHKEALEKQFEEETNPANCFHLGVMLLYVNKMGQMLHVPGKMIVDVLQELNSKIEKASDFVELVRFGDKVKEYLTAKIKKQPEEEEILTTLNETLPEFKRLITNQ